MESYTINKNAQFNSLEVVFNGKPSEAVRTALKSLKFRWHSVRKLWYGYADEETVRAAIEGGAAEKATDADVNGVKVGDLFCMSWGYEQTNVDFFQVVALAGKTSVRVRNVNPPVISEDECSGMSCNRTYEITRELLPGAFSVFIHDSEKGDIKRVNKADNGLPYLKIGSHYAHICKGETETQYVSWYY